jgi:Arc/MetJ-type ribon-helix-helix transcriptional regulator
VSTPVSARLEDEVVAALDRAVAAGLAANRAAVIAQAVGEWLVRHGEEEIVASYRRRYSSPELEHDDLIERLAAFSVAACLAERER